MGDLSEPVPMSGAKSLMDFVQHLWPESSREALAGWQTELLENYQNIQVAGVSSDSRQITRGDLFFALSGLHVDGMQFVDQALRAGAVAVFAEANEDDQVFDVVQGRPLIRVHKLAKQLSALAAFFYGEPSTKMPVIGVTGTNGKTSIAYMLASLLACLSGRSGLIGTLGYGVISNEENFEALTKTGFTTPDAITAQSCLAQFAASQCSAAVMEVSSHALVQHRVEAVEFSVAVLSNISRDHLDYHETMAAYACAKRRLFEFDSLRHAVLNLDDSYARKFLPELVEGLDVLTYSIKDSSASLFARDIHFSESGFSTVICFECEEYAFSCNLLGDFNVLNCLAVIGVLLARGFDMQKILQAFSNVHPLPGRMQRVVVSAEGDDAANTNATSIGAARKAELDISVIVDYAHTPEALELVLLALRQHTSKQLICVFGCGGDRDIGKRPLMGEIAERCADKVYLTSDNPRNEDPQLIIDDICRGLNNKADAVIALDRDVAISQAIAQAESGALVLVAGKGHENEQLIKGKRYTFNDYEVAQRELLKRVAA